jgi:hypothetical protein
MERAMVPIAYSPRALAKAFSPALSERLIRKMIAAGAFRTVSLGRRKYILRSEIETALTEMGVKQHG